MSTAESTSNTISYPWSDIEDDGFIGLVGPMFIHREETGRFRFLAEAKHRNRSGLVQGGMLMTFADRAMGMTAREGRQITVTTVQLNLQFAAPGRMGDMIDIRCSTIRKTRSLIFMEAKLSVGDKIIATASGVWKLLEHSEVLE